MGRLWETIGGKRVRTPAGIRHQAEEWDSTAKYKKKRAARNTARRRAIRAGRVHKGDGKDIDHIKGVEAGNSPSNLRVMSSHANRGRRQASRKRGSRRASWKQR